MLWHFVMALLLLFRRRYSCKRYEIRIYMFRVMSYQ